MNFLQQTFLLLLACVTNSVAQQSGSCTDSTESFVAVKPGDRGWTKMKTCDGWVNRKSTAWRCYNVGGVQEACPLTCTNCCEENTGDFTLIGNGKVKNCAWAAAQNTAKRCSKPPTRQNCAVTCGICGPTRLLLHHRPRHPIVLRILLHNQHHLPPRILLRNRHHLPLQRQASRVLMASHHSPSHS